jgi:hypothetical protein
VDRAFGAVFLPKRKEAIGQDDRENRPAEDTHALARLAPFGKEGKRRRTPENKREEMGETAANAFEERLALDPFDPVRAEFSKSAPGLRLRRAPPGCCAGWREHPRPRAGEFS